MLKSFKFIAVISVVSILTFGQTKSFKTEGDLVDHLVSITKCENLKVGNSKSKYCKLSFQGLAVEWAGVDSKNGGTIYINSLGSGQTIRNEGSHCLVVSFKEGELGQMNSIGAHIIFHANGNIIHNFDNEAGRRKCK
ncbi:MAG: hypothetical protein JNM24_17450 [Bdellovibrionaceae bacterium]|nr:hypothetical protein [Pseudobdellovibrionaceae bacterium]